MVASFLMVFFIGCISLSLSYNRFLNCLIILENFNILLLMYALISSAIDRHMIFIILMVVSTIEVIVGLVVLTRLWESSGALVV
jgi:NADH:ubiquinone oxidoreductase subunit K